tara:strand:+ start:26 stop:802 length:777 start_codon:yes stop_codon:yes gene_type:complete
MVGKRKRALHSAMTQLETEVEHGHVNEGAHVRLSKCLKTTYDATPDDRTKHVRTFLVDMLVQAPISAMSVPLDDRHIIEDEAFLRELIHAKRKDGKDIKDDWWEDLLEGLLPGWMLEDPDDQGIHSVFRSIAITLLRVRWNTLAPLEAHLNKLKVVPAELFFLNLPADATDCWASVWQALSADARFVRWLLKGKDKGGYSSAHRAQLREFAFDHADKMARKDPEWLKALGLRNIMEYMGCELNRMLGASFVDARAMAQ